MFFDLFSLFPTYFRYVAELEKSIVSVERIREYQSTPQEAAFNLPDIDPEPSWPLRGEIIFQDYATRYRDGNEYMCNDMNVALQSWPIRMIHQYIIDTQF